MQQHAAPHLLKVLAQLDDALEMCDAVHSAVADHTLDTMGAPGRAELVERLRELAYVVQETLHELDAGAPTPQREDAASAKARGAVILPFVHEVR